MDAIQKIDAVLYVFTPTDRRMQLTKIQSLLKEKLIVDNGELTEILNELSNDGYIRIEPHENNMGFVPLATHYALTFKGEIYQLNGGYKTNRLRAKRAARNENLKDFFLMFGTLLAGIGTLSLFVIEILKHYYWKP